MDFTYDTTTVCWLIIGLRAGNLTDDPTDPWFRQEGEIVSVTDCFRPPRFIIRKKGPPIRATPWLPINDTAVVVQTACERTTCTTDCRDTNTTALYTQGLTAAGLENWDDFKIYTFTDTVPDYEIP